MTGQISAADHLRHAQEAYDNRDWPAVAGEASLAAAKMLAEFLDLAGPRTEPLWHRHDQVRYRKPGVEFIALLQGVDEEYTVDGRRWWFAQVMRVVNDLSTSPGPMVGSMVRLAEGGQFTSVARFPS